MSKKGLLKGSHLYVILDREFLKGEDLYKVANLTLSAGASMIQLRDKNSSTKELLKIAKSIKAIAKRFNVPFIVNDRPEVSAAIDSDGLHIGQGDLSLSLARRLLHKDRLLGVSVKNFGQALRAKRGGASYLGVGPVFKTPVKPGSRPKGLRLLKKLKKLNMPLFAIGGIDRSNIHRLAKNGFKNIAVIRAVCASRNPYRRTKELKAILESR